MGLRVPFAPSLIIDKESKAPGIILSFFFFFFIILDALENSVEPDGSLSGPYGGKAKCHGAPANISGA